jgi:transcriptional regulator with XRE-family HTH domain
MRDETDIVRDRQLAIRRELDRRGILLKTIALDAGMSYSTIQSYFPGERNAVPATMSVAALYALVGAIPDDLLSLLLPAGRAIVQVPDGIDHDALCESMQEYLTEKAKAHRPDSPAGRDIADCEREVLDSKVVALPLGRVA